MGKELQDLSNRDKQFIIVIVTFVLFSCFFNITLDKGMGSIYTTDLEMAFFLGSIAALSWIAVAIPLIAASDLLKSCLRPDLMRIIFVIAFLLSIVGFLKQNTVLSNTAFFSVVLFPFLDWLDISIKIPQNTASTLLYSIAQTIVLLFINALLDLIL